MNLRDLLAARERDLKAAEDKRDAALARQNAILDAVTAAGRAALTPDEDRDVTAASADKRSAAADAERLTGEAEQLRAEIAADEVYAARSAETRDAAARPAYDAAARVVSEERTYAPHRERGFVRHDDNGRAVFRAGAKPGAQFERDVLNVLWLNPADFEARDRLARHQKEEATERGQYLERAVGVAAFSGLVVPQYLTELYAPAAAAGRPFADAIATGPGGHLLPPTGNTVEISQITTASSNALHGTENQAVSETNMDDTLLSIAVQTAAGQQTVSRKAIERGSGVEPIVLDDLYRRNASILDSTLLNQGTTGLTAVATAVTYTDASPTAAELYPRVLEAQAGVEGALLDMATGEMLAVMNSRRWYWMQSQVGSTFPFVTQPGIPAQQGAIALPSTYGKGIRGILPNGTPIIVDNNVATNLGTGTNEDEIYVGDRGEFHLWEDPDAPMFIRAEQTAAASLGILLVVYSYFAYTHARRAHARKIAGTGLVTPTWTGA